MLQKVAEPKEEWPVMSRELIDQLNRLVGCFQVDSPNWQAGWEALDRLASKEARRQGTAKSTTE